MGKKGPVLFRDRLLLERAVWKAVRKRLNGIEKALFKRARLIPESEITAGLWGEDAIERWLDDQLKEEVS